MDTTSPSAEQPEAPAVDSSKAEAESYLESLINKTLRVYTTDSRLFVGTFKCTDPVRRPRPMERQKLHSQLTSSLPAK